MATVHLVYPYDPGRIAAPWSIGNHLTEALRAAGYDVAHYDCATAGEAVPTGPDDVLLGHPWPASDRTAPAWDTVFNASLWRAWRARIALAPWTPSPHCAWALEVLPLVDHFCAITGQGWWPPTGRWGEFASKMSRHDVGVNLDHYPRVKYEFNPSGKRRAVYVGCCLPEKGTDLLAAASEQLRPGLLAHIGPGTVGGRVVELGRWDFGWAGAQRELRWFDVVVAPGGWDANPTTIVEAMAWGLIPLCGPRAGYGPGDGALLFGDHTDALAQSLRGLDTMEGSGWVAMRESLRQQHKRLLVDRYSWGVVCGGIVDIVRQYTRV